MKTIHFYPVKSFGAGRDNIKEHFINPDDSKRTLCGKLISKNFTTMWSEDLEELDDEIGCFLCRAKTEKGFEQLVKEYMGLI